MPQSKAACRAQQWRGRTSLVRLEVYMESSLRDRLRSAAAARGVSQAQLLRSLIEGMT
ncbi:MAG: hypothetical protein HN344_03305 [Gammaproteobacteria bacterium]|nr:hypothetical protein [Gammaproteobacteria bacterium]